MKPELHDYGSFILQPGETKEFGPFESNGSFDLHYQFKQPLEDFKQKPHTLYNHKQPLMFIVSQDNRKEVPLVIDKGKLVSFDIEGQLKIRIENPKDSGTAWLFETISVGIPFIPLD